MKSPNLNRQAINLLKESKLARYLHGKLKGHEQAISREDLSIGLLPKVILADNKLFLAHGFSIKPDTNNVDEKIPSILGWVPYIIDKTTVVIYHFFSVNYALRKQAFVKISLVKNLSAIRVIKFWLPSGHVHEFDLREHFQGLEADSVFIELFHPKLPKNHGGHSGHLRAWGKYYSHDGHYLSTVHTAPLARNNGFSASKLNARTYFPSGNAGETNYIVSRSHTRFISEATEQAIWNIKPQHFGFNVIKDNNGNVLSLWHHAPINGVALARPRGEQSLKTTQAFWVPDYMGIDPIITVDSLETLLSENQEIKIYLIANNQAVDSRTIPVNGSFSSKVSNIFGHKVAGEYVVLCEFWCNTFGYLHVHYNTENKSGDQVHAHLTNWKVDDSNQLIAIPSNGRGLARKFLHIPTEVQQNHSYLIVHNNKISGVDNPKVKVRLITDLGHEELVNLNLGNTSPINVYRVSDLFPNIAGVSNLSAIIQLESSNDNYDGSILNYNLASKAVAIDHLTGG